jgi:AraC-like DNA-binding protein
MDGFFSTADAPRAERSGLWADVIGSTYFPLDLRFRHPASFDGRLQRWALGGSSISRLTSDGLSYRRERSHLRHQHEEQYLVTVPVAAEVSFRQRDDVVVCRPGGFLIERGHEPYEFSHAAANDLWVLKVGGEALRRQVRTPDLHCGIAFEAAGAGGLFIDLLRLLPLHLGQIDPEGRDALEAQLVDLLALAIRADPNPTCGAASSVRQAHLRRVDTYIRRHLADPGLDPERIAGACGISTRYLHDLFREGDRTVCRWIRDLRLTACRDALAEPGGRSSVAAIAYAWGFPDQAHFSRAFKAMFGQSPRDYRLGRRRAQGQ